MTADGALLVLVEIGKLAAAVRRLFGCSEDAAAERLKGGCSNGPDRGPVASKARRWTLCVIIGCVAKLIRSFVQRRGRPSFSRCFRSQQRQK